MRWIKSETPQCRCWHFYQRTALRYLKYLSERVNDYLTTEIRSVSALVAVAIIQYLGCASLNYTAQVIFYGIIFWAANSSILIGPIWGKRLKDPGLPLYLARMSNSKRRDIFRRTAASSFCAGSQIHRFVIEILLSRSHGREAVGLAKIYDFAERSAIFSPFPRRLRTRRVASPRVWMCASIKWEIARCCIILSDVGSNDA